MYFLFEAKNSWTANKLLEAEAEQGRLFLRNSLRDVNSHVTPANSPYVWILRGPNPIWFTSWWLKGSNIRVSPFCQILSKRNLKMRKTKQKSSPSLPDVR